MKSSTGKQVFKIIMHLNIKALRLEIPPINRAGQKEAVLVMSLGLHCRLSS